MQKQSGNRLIGKRSIDQKIMHYRVKGPDDVEEDSNEWLFPELSQVDDRQQNMMGEVDSKVFEATKLGPQFVIVEGRLEPSADGTVIGFTDDAGQGNPLLFLHMYLCPFPLKRS